MRPGIGCQSCDLFGQPSGQLHVGRQFTAGEHPAAMRGHGQAARPPRCLGARIDHLRGNLQSCQHGGCHPAGIHPAGVRHHRRRPRPRAGVAGIGKQFLDGRTRRPARPDRTCRPRPAAARRQVAFRGPQQTASGPWIARPSKVNSRVSSCCQASGGRPAFRQTCWTKPTASRSCSTATPGRSRPLAGPAQSASRAGR